MTHPDPIKKAPATATVLASLAFVLFSAIPVAADAPGDRESETARLIKQLGSESFAEREAAEQRLIEIGAPAIPALREALNHPDPEVSYRARRAYKQLAELTPASREQLRTKAEQAFKEGDYEAMAWTYELLAAAPGASFDDCLWLGHTHQLTGNWPKAVAGYKKALQVIETRLNPAPGNYLDLRAPTTAGGPLILLIGLLTREYLKEPEAAAAIWTKATTCSQIVSRRLEKLHEDCVSRAAELLKAGKADVDSHIYAELLYPVRALRELAITQERLGQFRRAAETWARVNLVCILCAGHGGFDIDIEPVGSVLQKLLPGEPLPPTPGLIVLSPRAPTTVLRMDDPNALAQAYRQSSLSNPFWEFAFSASPGEEFKTLDFACDIEQLEPRFGGQFRCWAMAKGQYPGQVEIGEIRWPQGEPPGRQVISRRFAVPAGAGLVHIRTGHSQGHYKVHSVTVEATFRRRQKPGPELVPAVWFQTEALPAGGTLSWNDRTIRSEAAYTGVKPGRYQFAYEVAGHGRKAALRARFVPGGRYGIFVNLDSPFQWTLTNLRYFPYLSSQIGRSELVKLADGSWLVAYCSNDSLSRRRWSMIRARFGWPISPTACIWKEQTRSAISCF